MTPSTPKRRGDPDVFGGAAAALDAAARYRLLLTRLPGRWELIIFDRECTGILRRLEGPVVDALRETHVLPPDLHTEGACDADKGMVQHIFLAAASLAAVVERDRQRPASAAEFGRPFVFSALTA